MTAMLTLTDAELMSASVLVELARRCARPRRVTRKRRDACWTARAAVSSSTDACILRIEKNLLGLRRLRLPPPSPRTVVLEIGKSV